MHDHRSKVCFLPGSIFVLILMDCFWTLWHHRVTENLIVEHLVWDFVRLNFGFDQLIYSYRWHHVMTDRLILILAPRKYKLHLEEKQVHSKLLALSLIRSTKTDLNPESSPSLHIDRHYFSHWVSNNIIAPYYMVHIRCWRNLVMTMKF